MALMILDCKRQPERGRGIGRIRYRVLAGGPIARILAALW